MNVSIIKPLPSLGYFAVKDSFSIREQNFVLYATRKRITSSCQQNSKNKSMMILLVCFAGCGSKMSGDSLSADLQ
jgi:hypothetical protein